MEEKKVIGIMSGTSVDEIDACLALIRPDLTFQIIDTVSMEFPVEIKEKVLQLANNRGFVRDICEMNFILGKLFADCANKFDTKADIISSHGQTIWHIPQNSTLQLGDISVIANNTNTLTVGDFRPADIALGGHGAPLVPFSDEIIFGRDVARCIQNIGGIGNVTILDPKGQTFAFDTGPGNMLIDYFAQNLFGQKCDFEGRLAMQGRINAEWLEELLQNEFYTKLPPKTTGREMFPSSFGGVLIDTPGMRELGAESADLSKTFHDIEELASRCKFNNCTHTNEPGCAILQALSDGKLEQRRRDSASFTQS
jgi:anhydro-N-acetylmuramic acid kinase